MADQESKVSVLSLATVAKDKADDAYELALELRAILGAMVRHAGDGSPLSDLSFTLERMAERACDAADVAHVEALRVLSALQPGEAVSHG